MWKTNETQNHGIPKVAIQAENPTRLGPSSIISQYRADDCNNCNNHEDKAYGKYHRQGYHEIRNEREKKIRSQPNSEVQRQPQADDTTRNGMESGKSGGGGGGCLVKGVVGGGGAGCGVVKKFVKIADTVDKDSLKSHYGRDPRDCYGHDNQSRDKWEVVRERSLQYAILQHIRQETYMLCE